jgi:hypothetical protein
MDTLLEVSNPVPVRIPTEFILVVPGDGLRLPCAVVWRTEYRMGVHFD